jgi:hypothetical protein
LVLAETGGKSWKNSEYFTQTLLPDYMVEHPHETGEWDVVYDARGHFVEPHVRMRLGLGTIDVRKYVACWHDGDAAKDLGVEIDEIYPTKGPTNRYRFALFIEKGVRQRTKRRTPLKTKELIAELNPLLRGWGEYYKRSHVRKLRSMKRLRARSAAIDRCGNAT